MPESNFVVGQTNGQSNEELFVRGSSRNIDWINVSRDGSNTTLKLQPLAKRPKLPTEQFPQTFTTEELLKIATEQLPSARSVQNQDVYIDGILPVALALKLSEVCRYARSVYVNVPREGGWKLVSERQCDTFSLVVGDLIQCSIFGNVVTAEVKAISDGGVQVAERNKRRGQRVWINDSYDIIGWATDAT